MASPAAAAAASGGLEGRASAVMWFDGKPGLDLGGHLATEGWGAGGAAANTVLSTWLLLRVRPSRSRSLRSFVCL